MPVRLSEYLCVNLCVWLYASMFLSVGVYIHTFTCISLYQ